MLRLLIIWLSLWWLTACSKFPVFSSGSKESLPERLQGAISNPDGQSTETPVANAKYSVTVTISDGNFEPCKGTVELTFTQGSSLSPKGSLGCVFGAVKIDLAEAIERYIGPKVKQKMKEFANFGYFTRMPNPADNQAAPFFSPPILNQIGPLVQNPSSYSKFNGYEETIQVTYPDPKAQKVRCQKSSRELGLNRK